MNLCKNENCNLCPGDGTFSHDNVTIVCEKKFLPMFLGEGDERKQIGQAEIEIVEGGYKLKSVAITDPEVGTQMYGRIFDMNPFIKAAQIQMPK